ncbi:hypothetical protein OGAPHI_001018 [Ogataea philodendri]|uniref:Temperature shock-inducible protein 1 n=1 Tax=Ogataea philodendri TaxID=1378263 RepID=A0A9P8T8P7_9ASCO|nr:uncharacterized protein OGAPHI_001018 [Ogataea philodendri]KAH3670503.1 hypothetical protein OGAPHI_001018 [Ogataea philodendri]
MLVPLALVSFCMMCRATTITTTISPSDAAEVAYSMDSGVIEAFLEDFGSRYQDYTAYMDSANMAFPGTLVEFYMEAQQQTTDTAKLSSLLANDFPMSDFKTYISAFPWYTSLLDRAGESTLYGTEDLASKTVALAQQSGGLDLKVLQASSTSNAGSGSSSQADTTVSTASSAGAATLMIPGIGLLLLGVFI